MTLQRIGEQLKSLYVAGWLGWQMESNWTDLYLFAVYSIVKPIASSLILVVMYLVITGGKTGNALFAYIFVGNAFYMLVGNVIYGVSWAIIDDREHFEMLKYIYISPVQIYLYLMGRGFAKLATTIEAVIVTLAFGMVFLHVPLDPLKVDYPYLLVSFVVGLAGIVCLGVILAGISLITARHASVASESVAGIFYLLCGVIFPIDVLPTWVQPLAKVLPPTYWLEAIRRATLGSSISPAMQGFSNGEILLILVATTVVLAFFSNAFFRYVEYIAKKRGCIDQLTGY